MRRGEISFVVGGVVFFALASLALLKACNEDRERTFWEDFRYRTQAAERAERIRHAEQEDSDRRIARIVGDRVAAEIAAMRSFDVAAIESAKRWKR